MTLQEAIDRAERAEVKLAKAREILFAYGEDAAGVYGNPRLHAFRESRGNGVADVEKWRIKQQPNAAKWATGRHRQGMVLLVEPYCGGC